MRELLVRREQRQRNGEIERDARFSHIGGREVHQQPPRRKAKPRVHHRRADAIA